MSPFAGFLIGPAPPLADGPGQIVTGTFAHSAANVINLYVDGLDEPIGTTDNHPFWSEDRQAFVPAGDLKSGERLRTQDGQLLALTASRPRAAAAVFNLEVNTEHVYYVGIQGLLVHNSYDAPGAPGTTSVYQSVDSSGQVVNYVGITGDLQRRAATHLGKKGIVINEIPGLGGLSRPDARAVEQVLIEYYGLGKNGGTLLNKINSIAKSNPKYTDAIERAKELLKAAGYPGF